MSEQTVSWRTKQISSVCKELKHELHEILILFLIDIVVPANHPLIHSKHAPTLLLHPVENLQQKRIFLIS